MSSPVKSKLKELPLDPGVYLYKDGKGLIIYVGKAARLRQRVGQYFQKSRAKDPKTEALVRDIVDLDWIETESEIDALFLEAELIKRYKPKYNIALKDDRSDIYVRLDIKSEHPTVSFTRRPTDDKAEYIGPFSNPGEVRRAMRYLRKIFPFDEKPSTASKVTLDYHIGLSPGLEENRTTLKEYRANLKKLRLYLLGKRKQLVNGIERDMKHASQAKEFEKAANLRDQLRSLKSLRTQVVFGDKEFINLSKDQALNGLSELLGLTGPPQRIEGYDISHLQGQNNVASMVVFLNGLPAKTEYRKFKMRKGGNDDFAHIHETINRRFSPRNAARWPKPDLMLIDGGKGQLSSALKALAETGIEIPVVGLAKRREKIVQSKDGMFSEIELDKDSHIRKLLIRIRDESHRFALSYQTTLSRKKQISSLVEEIPGIGPATRKKLIREFGSIGAALKADKHKLDGAIGTKKAELIRSQLSTKESGGNK